jgi:hypothetical protein
MALNIETAKELLQKLKDKYTHALCFLVFPIPDGPKPGDVEQSLKEIKEMGYSCYVRTSEFGDEIVVTHRDITEEGFYPINDLPWRK